MIVTTPEAIATIGHRAAAIEELCTLIADALQYDPDTARVGIAVQGLATLAGGMARDLFDMADPNG